MVDTVILAVIDCLRADHVGAYGYRPPTTPTLDALALQGVLWERAHSASSWTRPSITSLLTGLYPIQHGVYEGIKRRGLGSGATTDSYALPHLTLAERFARGGWRCAALLDNAQLGSFSGLNRGFDVYRSDVRKADNILAALGDWLRAAPRRPAFAYLHFMEAHWPYKPRRHHVKVFGGDRDGNCFRGYSAKDFGRLRRALERKESSIEPGRLEQMIQLYDGAIRRLDGCLRRLVRLLNDLNRWEHAVLVVTADHGDELLDHGGIGHGHALYEELTHVPLVARVPKGPQGLRLPRPVSLVDLADTLVRVAGVETPAGEIDLLCPDGRSRPVISEVKNRQRYRQTIQRDNWKLYRRYKFPADMPQNPLHGPLDQLKLSDYFVRDELFDLSIDPGERTNRSADPDAAPVLERLRSALDQWWMETIAECRDVPHTEVEIDETVVDRLRDLGYLE